MFNFTAYIDLPLIWGGIIAIAVFMYVLLDGFDLGVGILFPFAPTDTCRDKMMNSIAPFWDGNETWLILGGGGLLAAFPLAYSIIMPAMYLPIIFMLIGLIFRGVAFEFRFKAHGSTRRFWDYIFHFGSMTATFAQGIILGSFIQGLKVEGRIFTGGAFDWLTPFSLTVGVALLCGYVLLGATWLIMKTDEEVHMWAREIALYIIFYVLVFMGLVSLWVPFLSEYILQRWFSWPNFILLAPIPLASIAIMLLLVRSIYSKNGDSKPFILTVALFSLCYGGLIISLWPWVIPMHFTIWEAAASPESLSLMLLGVGLILPIILFYTGYCYYVFRGKVTSKGYY